MALKPERERGSRPRRRFWRATLVLLMVAGAALSGWALLQRQRLQALNDAIGQGAVFGTPGSAAGALKFEPGQPPEWRFAQGVGWAEQGELDAALTAYRSLYDDPRLGLAARFNSANALLREAQRLREVDQKDKAVVLAELAKEAYRSVLRQMPDQWDARYNFERAQRLQPDPVPSDQDGGEPPGQSERAATTMRGISKGLP